VAVIEVNAMDGPWCAYVASDSPVAWHGAAKGIYDFYTASSGRLQ